MMKMLSYTTMMIQFPRPKLALSSRKQSYNRIADNVLLYEQQLKNNTLTVKSQDIILTNISKDCHSWLLEDKGEHLIQGKYISTLQKIADSIIDQNKNSLVTKSNKVWFQHKWAWDRAVIASKKQYSHEPFEFYVAVQKWINQMYVNRNGAWYILTNFLKTQQNVDVGLDEGGMEASSILGTPSTTINIPGSTYQNMVFQLRRAHKTMFDPAIEYMEGSTQWQHVQGIDYFKAVSRHIFADVQGPL